MLVRLLLTAILVTTMATVASAQRTGGGGSRSRGGGGGEGGGVMLRAQRQSKFEEFLDKLKLNNDQKQEVGKIFTAAAQEAAQVRNKLDQARAQIAGAYIDGKSEEEIKKAGEAYTELAAQMTGIETKVFSQVYALLKPNQQSKAPQAFDVMAGIFTPPARQAAGGGRGQSR